MKYSVIIPVYNAENTIERCLQSLLSQNRGIAEILLIDDGSTDRSGEICKKYESEYSFIRCFSKENGGVSSARNYGLDNASGEYVLFVDSDDYVEENYFEQIDSVINSENPDLMIYKLRLENEDAIEETRDLTKIAGENMSAMLAAELKKGTMYSLCSKVFRRDLIEKNKLRFKTGQYIAEDLQFVFSYLMEVKSAVKYDCSLYIVSIDNGDSLSRKKRTDLGKQLLNADMGMFEVLDCSAISDENKTCFRGALTWLFYRSVYSASKELLKFKMNGRERRKKIREICKAYNSKGVVSNGWKCRLFALPVRLKLAVVIDCMAKFAARR